MALVFDQIHGAIVTDGMCWYRFKELLKTCGWSVLSSGDATSYFSNSDGITHGGTGAGGMNNTNSWFRIRMPSVGGVTRELTIKKTGSGSGTINYSFSAGFTGGTPNATTTPTATDQVTVRNGAIWSSDDSFHFYMGAQNAAPYGAFGIVVNNANPNSNNSGGILIDPIVAGTGPSGDPDPYIWLVETTSSGSFNFSKLGSVGLAWLHKGKAEESFVTVTAEGQGGGGSNQGYPNLMIGSDSINYYDSVAAVVWTKVGPTEPFGIKGQSTLMKWNGGKRYSAQKLTLNSTGDRITCADVNFPWDGSAVVI